MDPWTQGDAYEAYVGRWSRRVAEQFVRSLAVPAGSRWLDVGCGTGALSETILRLADPAEVRGLDASEAFVAFAREHVRDPRAGFEAGDAQALPFEDARFDAVVSGLMLNFVPEPQQAANEVARVLRAGALAAAYVWDYAGEMQFMRRFWDAATALDPSAAALDEGRRFSVCNLPALERLFTSAGLRDVSVSAIDVETRFRDFDDYWSPFLGGQGPAPGYVASLPESERTALRERLSETLPTGADGSIPLVARALVVRGSK
jgi:SAM-dependent methyltransferase